MESTTKLALVCVLLISGPLRAQEEPVEQEVSEQPTTSKMWKETLAWQGDFRLRFEAIDEQGEAERNRFRFRARFGLASQLTENMQFTMRIARSDGDPVSTNLTLVTDFPAKTSLSTGHFLTGTSLAVWMSHLAK